MTQPVPRPTTEAVAVEWTKTMRFGTLGAEAVATTVPAASQWPLVGTSRLFVQVVNTGGGTVGDTPYHRDIVSLDVWATKDNSDRPPLGLASSVAQDLWAVAMDSAGGFVTVSGKQVRVDGTRPISASPRRIPDQDQSRAHYSLDVEISWTEEG